MGSWYRVTKRINGRPYDYWQRTYRVGKSVKTENRYIGPAHNNVSAPFSPSVSTTAPLVPEDVMETYFRPYSEEHKPGNIRKLNAEKKAILRNEEHFDAGAFDDVQDQLDYAYAAKKNKAAIRDAKRATKGIKAANVFLAKGIKKP